MSDPNPSSWPHVIAFLLPGAAAAAIFLLCRRSHLTRKRSERAGESELLERLAAGLAHEIKNPLGALNLNIQLLEEELDAAGALGGVSRERLATIKREYRRLEAVVDNFLRYAGRRQLSLSEVDLNALVADLLTFIKPEFRGRGVVLEAHLADGPLVCRCDSDLLKQAVLNILLNALEAIPEEGTVRVRTRADDGHVVLSVSDTGVGIPPENMARIFEAYFSTKATGTGLGLPISRRIIEDHGGRITVESPSGKGTIVAVFLPAAARKPRNP